MVKRTKIGLDRSWRVIRLASRPIPDLTGWLQVIVAVVATAGLSFVPDFGPFLAVGFVALLFFIAAVRLQMQNDRLRVPSVEISAPHVKRNIVFQPHAPDDPFDVAAVLIVNTAISSDPAAEARNIEPLVRYLGAGDEVVATSFGRWSEKDHPASRPLGASIEDLRSMTLRANGAPHTFEVAFRYHADNHFYPYDDNTFDQFRATGDTNLRQRKPLPNPTKVQIGLLGSGIKVSWQEFILRLGDAGLELKEPDQS